MYLLHRAQEPAGPSPATLTYTQRGQGIWHSIAEKNKAAALYVWYALCLHRTLYTSQDAVLESPPT